MCILRRKNRIRLCRRELDLAVSSPRALRLALVSWTPRTVHSMAGRQAEQVSRNQEVCFGELFAQKTLVLLMNLPLACARLALLPLPADLLQ